MNLKTKKWLTYISIATFYFLSGVEYAVILPTLWLYIHERFHAENYFLGLILSALSFTGLFASPLMGRWYDWTKKTKYIILFANIWEIGGNVLYFIGINKWYILASRMIAGVGTGAGAAIVADVSRATTKEERTAVLSIVMLCRQVGLLIGPVFNLFLRLSNFYIGPYLCDAYTSPGAFMALLWCILQVMVLFMYFDLPKLVNSEQIKTHIDYSPSDTAINQNCSTQSGNQTTTSYPSYSNQTTYQSPGIQSNKGSTTAVTHHGSLMERTPSLTIKDNHPIQQRLSDDYSSSLTVSNEIIESAERFMTSGGGSSERLAMIDDWYTAPSPTEELSTSVSYQSQSPRNSLHSNTQIGWWENFCNEYIREEIIVILFAVFASFFNQLGLETMVTPITLTFLGWKEFENSLMYFFAGVEICIVFVILRFLSKYMYDVTLILVAYIIEIMANTLLIVWFPLAQPNSQSNLIPLILGIFLDVLGLPLLAVCTTSLYSKLTKDEIQGTSHGIRQLMIGLGMILGPLWTGTLIKNLYVMLGVMLGLMVLALIMLLFSFKKLWSFEKSLHMKRHIPEPVYDEDETRPLLS